MALQELDLTIVHHSGRHTTIVDALSRCPLPTSIDNLPAAKVVALTTEETTAVEEKLSLLQSQDKELAPIIQFLPNGLLPTEEKLARKVALTSSQYTIVDEVLYWIESESTL